MDSVTVELIVAKSKVKVNRASKKEKEVDALNKKEKIPAQYTIYINNYENKKTNTKTHKEAIYAVFKNNYVPNLENNSTGISLLKKIDKEQIFKIARQKTEKRQKNE